MTIQPRRLLVIQGVQTMYEALMAAVVPPAVAPEFVPSYVQIGPLGDADKRKQLAIGLVAGTERKSHLFPQMHSILPISVEFQYVINQGDEKPGVTVERLLGFLQNIVLADHTLGGTAIDVNEVGNEVDMVTWGNRYPAGVIHFEAQYRHSEFDVTKAV